MECGGKWRRGPGLVMAGLLVACGGATSGDPEPSGTGGSSSVGDGGQASGGRAGGSGGARPFTGGAPSTGGAASALPDCKNSVPAGTPCSEPSAHCGGPCSNSWQVDVVCKNGMWEYDRVVPCGPNASHAPQCKNSFSGGELTPCCPEGQLVCAGKPDGYPGFGCTPGDGSFCSCSCYGGTSQCGC